MTRKQNDFTVDSHSDDIMCLCMNNLRSLVATGQVGHQPQIFIWDALTAAKKGMYKLPKATRSVTAIAFSKDSKLIASADFSNDHNIYVHKWESGEMLFKRENGGNKILMIEWSLKDNTFISLGLNHTYFWDLAGNKKKGS